MGGSFEFFQAEIKTLLLQNQLKDSTSWHGRRKHLIYLSKIWFGDASPTNTYTEKKQVDFTNYYYFDKAGVVTSDDKAIFH